MANRPITTSTGLSITSTPNRSPSGNVGGDGHGSLKISFSRFAFIIAFLLVLLLTGNTFAQNKSKHSQLKVMSYNIHYGIGMDKKYDLARIAKVISDQDPDIVGLQEIGNLKMAEELGKLTSMKVVFGQSLGRDTGYGDAVLCKHPFKWVGNHSIPSASSSRYQAMAIDINLSKITGKETTIRFINTHFDWLKTIGSEQSRLASVDVIEQAFLKNYSSPTILTGDLNAGPKSATLSKLASKGWLTKTGGGTLNTSNQSRPPKQIDYVLFKPKGQWKAIEMKVLPEPVASDHLPVLMTFRWTQ